MEKMERRDLWLEVERMAAEWSEARGATHVGIPLERLRPLWNSNHRLMEHDHQKLETLACENLLLKFELTQLKRQLEHSTHHMRVPASKRRHAG
jgi:hypothetical protein